MAESSNRVIDTNVAIGLTLKRHTHHEKSWEFVVEDPSTVYLPPTANEEFLDLKESITGDIKNQLSEHQSKTLSHFSGKEKLDRDDLRYIQRNLIDDDWDVARFLHDYYDDLISGFEVDILQLEYDIGDMIAEVGTDPCEEEFGGWRNVVKRWTRGVDPYDRLKSNLLLFEGDDPDVCIEAHHIAIETGLPTELGTADGHFIDQHEKEPRCRKEDILSKTELDDVVDLRP